MARLQAGHARPLQSNQMEMPQRLRQTVFHNIIRDIIGGGLGLLAGVAHRYADACVFQHRHIVAAVTEGDALLPRQPKMCQRLPQAVGLAAALG